MKTYYNPEDLKKFGNIGEFQKKLADKFFDYYGETFKEGALTAREKSLIALDRLVGRPSGRFHEVRERARRILGMSPHKEVSHARS